MRIKKFNEFVSESLGKDYKIESLYDVIKDELKGSKEVKDWIKLTKSMGSLNDFIVRGTNDPDELGYDVDANNIEVSGNRSILGAVVAPILIRMKIFTPEEIKDPNTVKIINRIAGLLYKDINPN